MKKLVLETTAPFQGLPELVAYDEGLFEQEGLIVEWADREKDVEKSTDINVVSPQGLDPFSSHGKLLEQGKADMYNACEWGNYCRVQDTARRQPPGRPPRHRHLRRARRSTGLAGLHRAATRRPHRRRAVLFRHPLSRAPYAGRASCRAIRSSVCRAPQRLAQPLRCDDDRRDRGDHVDRALRHTRREERLPPDLRGVLPRHRSRLRQGRRRDLRRLQSRGPRGGAPHQRQQGARTCTTSSTITRAKDPEIALLTVARPAREPHRRLRPRADPATTKCSAPTTG